MQTLIENALCNIDDADVTAAQEQSTLVNNEKHDVLYIQRC